MTLYAGVDGGQSSTVAVVGEVGGAILGRGVAGPADEVGCDAASTRMKDALETALARALGDAHLPRTTHLEAVVAGISGFGGAPIGISPAFNATRMQLLHDAPIAHAGAFAGGAGVLVIAGTGSVVYGVGEDGRIEMAGGLGYAFGDEGSAFGIARAALARADGDAPMRERMREAFGFDVVLDLVRAFYAGAITRERIAAFTETLLASPDDGVDRIVDAQLSLLAVQIERVRTSLGENVPVAATGGLTRSAYYMKRLRRLENLADPIAEPVIGALRMAILQAPLRDALRAPQDDTALG